MPENNAWNQDGKARKLKNYISNVNESDQSNRKGSAARAEELAVFSRSLPECQDRSLALVENIRTFENINSDDNDKSGWLLPLINWWRRQSERTAGGAARESRRPSRTFRQNPRKRSQNLQK